MRRRHELRQPSPDSVRGKKKRGKEVLWGINFYSPRGGPHARERVHRASKPKVDVSKSEKGEEHHREK